MKRILVIQLARFGDLMQTKRLLASLANGTDKTELHLCLDQSLAALAAQIYPECILHPIRAHGTGARNQGEILSILSENAASFAQMASCPFDAVYNLNFSPLNFRLAMLFDPDCVHGYRTRDGQDIVDNWPSLAMRWSRDRRVGLNLVDFWAGYAPCLIRPEEVNTPAHPKSGGVGIVLAGRESRRSLPVPLLATIAQTAWKSHSRGAVHLVGSASETPAARAFFKELPSDMALNTRDWTGKTDWIDLIELVDSLDLLLTPDTGVMHLAAHLGTPVTAFFLSSAWCFETGPYGTGHTVFQAVDDCLPCLETRPCPYAVRCLNGMNSPAFLRFLTTGKTEHAPPGLLGLKSGFDELGVTYAAFGGIDEDAPRRERFRSFLSRHLYAQNQARALGAANGELASQLYLERDWMLNHKTNQRSKSQS